jgi:hemerythrin-like domain-containing protein
MELSAGKEQTMYHEDHFEGERHRVERVLEILERAASRLDARGHVPLELLNDAVEFVRASEEAAYEDSQAGEEEPALSACVKQHTEARAPVQGMQHALHALERGETAAAARFAQFAREYIRLRRDHMRLDDRLFSHPVPVRHVGDDTVESPATRRVYQRLIESSSALT